MWKVASTDNCSIFYQHAQNSSRDSQAKLIVRSVIKWREFRGNKKNCDDSDLLHKTLARLMQLSKLVKNKKKPVFLFIHPDFWMDGKGYFLHASSHSKNVASARRVDCWLFYSLDLQQTLTLRHFWGRLYMLVLIIYIAHVQQNRASINPCTKQKKHEFSHDHSTLRK